MMPSPPDPVSRVSPRQRECLRLVYLRRTTKEIAAALGLSPGTIDSYLAEAVAVLGARNRRHAAELLHASEAGGGGAGGGGAGAGTPAGGGPAGSGPSGSGGTNSGVEDRSGPEATTGAGSGADWQSLLPIRRKGTTGNDLSPFARLFWIAQLAIGFAIAFGMLAVGIDVIGRLL